MPQDKFTAVWVSHTSISDFLNCPRAYYLKNVYKDKKTGHKIQIMAPPLALGQAVHEVLESLSVLPTNQRFNESLISRYEVAWKKLSGKRGGFTDMDTEYKYKQMGADMLRMVMNHPGPIARPAVKIKEDLPYFWLSEEANIILCGKIDWLEYLQDTDSVNIIDFKTSKRPEHESSLQLPIYHLLVHNCQKRKVEKASYWYLRLSEDLEEKKLPDLESAHTQILDIAKQIKTARQLSYFKCREGEDGCFHCRPMEAVLRGEAEFVGENSYRQDVYILGKAKVDEEEESVIL